MLKRLFLIRRVLKARLLLLTILGGVFLGITLGSFYGKEGSLKDTYIELQKPVAVESWSQFNKKQEEKKWLKYIELVGGEKAYKELKSLYFERPYPLQHAIMHVIGEVFYSKFGLEGVVFCDGSFGFGCYHQFFIESILEHGVEVVPRLAQICVDKFGEEKAGTCQHGIGHGILEYYGSSSEGNLIKALEACASLSVSLNMQRYCNGGALMEYQNVPFAGDEPALLKIDEENPTALCINLPNQFKESCYKSLGLWFIVYYEYNFSKAAILCDRSEPSYLSTCYLGIGMAASPVVSFSYKNTRDACLSLLNKANQDFCFIGASRSFIIYRGDFEAAEYICEKLSESKKSLCRYQ